MGPGGRHTETSAVADVRGATYAADLEEVS